jgi:hypothetical protein
MIVPERRNQTQSRAIAVGTYQRRIVLMIMVVNAGAALVANSDVKKIPNPIALGPHGIAFQIQSGRITIHKETQS